MANTDAHVSGLTATQSAGLFYSPRVISTAYAYPNAVADSTLEIFQKSYDIPVTAPREGVITIYGPGDGIIQKISIWASIQTGSAIFNVERDGVALFSGGSRPQIDFAGDPFVVIDDLSQVLTFGDTIDLDVEQAPAGGIARLVFQMDVLMDQ